MVTKSSDSIKSTNKIINAVDCFWKNRQCDKCNDRTSVTSCYNNTKNPVATYAEIFQIKMISFRIPIPPKNKLTDK